MKVIKMGKPPKPEWPRSHTCRKCKSQLEYDEIDVKDDTDPRDRIPYYWIKCPVCQSQESIKF